MTRFTWPLVIVLLVTGCRTEPPKVNVVQSKAGGELILIPKRVLDGMQVAVNKATLGASPGALTWPALLRKLDRLDSSFRH